MDPWFGLAAGERARIVGPLRYARVAELADAYGSGPYGETRGGSSPLASNGLGFLHTDLHQEQNNRNARHAGSDRKITSPHLSFLPPSELSLAGKAVFARQASVRLFSVPELFSSHRLFFVPPSEPSLAQKAFFGLRA